MRYVLDTNVFVSAFLLPHSIPRQALQHARERGTILLSDAVLTELRDVLSRDKLRRYAEEEDVRDFLAGLATLCEWVDPDRDVTACRDPRDDKFLTLAVSGRATHLITGDADLLVLDPFEGVRILTPRQFVEI
ncbi:MAG: putative toxin-antitoxin system toxin component, PIN family [Acidobacteriota bacterium]